MARPDSAAPLRAATRGSPLARWQTDHVARLLGTEIETVVVETTGDLRPEVPIAEMGGTGVFVKEVQTAVLEGRADFAVHSAKDLPSLQAEGLLIAAVPERGDPRDALVGSTLDDLAQGATVATGSVRRKAQLAWLRPDLTFAELRGNIDTRLRKAEDFGAIVMAVAALQRLGLDAHIAEILDPATLLPQVAQGALAVECREEDEPTRSLLAAIEHAPSRVAVDAERSFLAQLGGGCDLPVGALARTSGSEVELTGLIATLDGRVLLRVTGTGPEPQALGRAVAVDLLGRAGGQALLDGLAGEVAPGSA